MLAAALACAALLRASTAAALAYEVGARGEGRFRTQERPGVSASQAEEAAELELAPRGALRLVGHAAEAALTYEPRLTWADLAGQRVAWFHQGSLAATWRPEARWELRARAEGGVGRIGFLEFLTRPATEGGLAPGQPVPAARTLPIERLQLDLQLTGQPAPRLRLSAGANQAWEGGRTADARLLYPRQQATRAQAAAEWQVDALDAVGATAAGQRGQFTSGPDLWAAQAGAAWRRRLAPEASLRLGLGLARSSADRTLLPAAEAELAAAGGAPEERRELRLALALAPVVDRLQAAVAERATLALWLSWSPGTAWRLELAGSGGRTLQGPARDSALWTGEVRGLRRFRDLLELGLGFRGLWQKELLRSPGLATSSSLLRDRAVFLWVGVHDRGWL